MIVVVGSVARECQRSLIIKYPENPELSSAVFDDWSAFARALFYGARVQKKSLFEQSVFEFGG